VIPGEGRGAQPAAWPAASGVHAAADPCRRADRMGQEHAGGRTADARRDHRGL